MAETMEVIKKEVPEEAVVNSIVKTQEQPVTEQPNNMHLESKTVKKYADIEDPENPLNSVYKTLLASKPQRDENREEVAKRQVKRASILSALQTLTEMAGATAGGNIVARGESKPLIRSLNELERQKTQWAAQNADWNNKIDEIKKLNALNWSKDKYAANRAQEEANKQAAALGVKEADGEKNRALRADIEAKKLEWAKKKPIVNKTTTPKPSKSFIDIQVDPQNNPNEYVELDESEARVMASEIIKDPEVEKLSPALFKIYQMNVQQGKAADPNSVKQLVVQWGWKYPQLLKDKSITPEAQAPVKTITQSNSDVQQLKTDINKSFTDLGYSKEQIKAATPEVKQRIRNEVYTKLIKAGYGENTAKNAAKASVK